MATSSFLSPDFDEVSFLRRVLHLPSSDSEQAALTRCINDIQVQIHDLVIDNSKELLHEVDVACAAEKSVSNVVRSVESLSSSVQRLRHTIDEPYRAVAMKLTELKNTMAAVEICRAVQRFLSIMTKLPETINTDLARAGRLLREIEILINTHNLQGIDVVDRQLDNVAAASAAIRSKAHEMLKVSLASQNHGDISTALQCFYSLGTLSRVVSNLVAEHKREAIKLLVRELDSQSIVSAIASSSDGESEGPKTRELVFSKLEMVTADVLQRTVTLSSLWKVLAKKKDPLTQEFFIASLEDQRILLNEYWTPVAQQLQEKILKLTKRGNLSVMLVSEYLRFYRVLNAFCTGISDALKLPAQVTSKWMQDTTLELSRQFTSHCLERHREKLTPLLSRMTSSMPVGAENTPVEVSSSRAGLPPQACSIDPRQLLQLLSMEISSHRSHPQSLSLILAHATTTLQQLRQKMTESLTRMPLVALPPSFAGTILTAQQLYHINLSNMSTKVAIEGGGVLGLLTPPEDSIAQPDYYHSFLSFKENINFFRSVATEIPNAFISACGVSLINCITVLVESSERQQYISAAALETAATNFVSRFLNLFDRQTPGLEDRLLLLVSEVLSRFIVRLISRKFNLRGEEVSWTQTEKILQQVPTALSSLYAVEKLPPRPKLMLRFLNSLFSTAGISDEILSSGSKSLPREIYALALLHRFAPLSFPCGLLASALKISPDNLRDALEHLAHEAFELRDNRQQQPSAAQKKKLELDEGIRKMLLEYQQIPGRENLLGALRELFSVNVEI